MEVGDDGTLRPATAHRLMLGRQVMKMKDIGPLRPSSSKRLLPHCGQMPGELDGDRRQHHIRGTLAILERRMHRHHSTGRATSHGEHPQRLGVVEVVHTSAREERRRMRVIPPLSERSSHQLHRPARSNQRPRQVPRPLRRPATRKEQQPHHDVSSHHHRQATTDAEARSRSRRTRPVTSRCRGDAVRH